jgi:mRNA interferase RelE/StbE
VSYSVRLESTAQKDLQHLSRDVLKRIDAKLSMLTDDPRPHGAAKLEGRSGQGWRIRVGDYRILYTVDDAQRVVSVYRIRPRGSAYRL